MIIKWVTYSLAGSFTQLVVADEVGPTGGILGGILDARQVSPVSHAACIKNSAWCGTLYRLFLLKGSSEAGDETKDGMLRRRSSGLPDLDLAGVAVIHDGRIFTGRALGPDDKN